MSWEQIQEGPAFGFTVVALIIVFGPLFAERVRLPGLLGLLVGGALIGPNMLDVLPSFDSLDSLGSLGVLYLIFLAGLQLDIDSFLRYRKISVGFGLLTAFIPLVLGTIAALLLGIDATAAVLIGSFWASFTLITYPTVSQYGLTRNRSVAAIVGASSITDTISLIILALIIGAEAGDSTGLGLVFSIAVGLVVLGLWCFVVVPWFARSVFTGLGQERTLRYMIVLIALTSSAVVAELVGIEALIGAFFAGAGMNRLVPNASPLMTVTDFFGNAFFIPTFLVSVGLLFDPEVMFVGDTLRLAAGFLVALVLGKGIAAWLAGRIFDLTTPEVGLMFSMSVAQAAATLAATIIGLEAGLYGDDIVNAVMVVVAASLIITSVGTSRFAPQISPPVGEWRRVGEAVLLPTANMDTDTLTAVVHLAGRLAEPVGGVVQPLVIATSTAPEAIQQARDEQARADGVLRRAGQDVETDLRVDRSVASGLNRNAIQSDSSLLLLAWPGRKDVRAHLLGASYSEIVAATAVPTMIAALHPNGDLTGRRLAVVVREEDLEPSNLLSLRIAADVASSLTHRGRPLIVGPVGPDDFGEIDVDLPEVVEYPGGPGDLIEWVRHNTDPGDTIILPFLGLELRSAAIEIHDSGRSVLAVTPNPESRSALNGSTMTLPVGGTLTPS